MKIGIVGPLDSCGKISAIMQEHFPQIRPIIYEVSKTEEAYLKINKSEKECDGLIFTGMGVYYKTIEKTDISLPHVYLPFSSSSIMKALWELKERFPKCKNISIDTVNRQDIEDVLEELNLKDINIDFMEYNHLYKEQKYIDFHLQAQKKLNTCISIIGLGWVYEQVTSLGYPTIRLYSTKSTIKNTINKLLYKVNEVIVKHSNLAVQVIYTKGQENISQYRKLEISSLIESNFIGYLKEIQGSIFNSNWNRFLIFSTKGAVENTQNLISLKNTLSFLKSKDIEIFVGTGLGMTAYESEANANKALEAALSYSSASIFKVENDKIEGPILDKGELSYNFIMDNDAIEEMAKMVDLNPLYIQKINSIKEKYNKDTFTSDELANYLSVSTRTANRIINKILDNNCGEVIGLETNKSVGRPKNIIRIKFNHN